MKNVCPYCKFTLLKGALCLNDSCRLKRFMDTEPVKKELEVIETVGIDVTENGPNKNQVLVPMTKTKNR